MFITWSSPKTIGFFNKWWCSSDLNKCYVQTYTQLPIYEVLAKMQSNSSPPTNPPFVKVISFCWIFFFKRVVDQLYDFNVYLFYFIDPHGEVVVQLHIDDCTTTVPSLRTHTHVVIRKLKELLILRFVDDCPINWGAAAPCLSCSLWGC